jgi:hypothetical protein
MNVLIKEENGGVFDKFGVELGGGEKPNDSPVGEHRYFI